MSQVDWLGPKVGSHLALCLHSSHEPGELWQCLSVNDDSIIKQEAQLLLGDRATRKHAKDSLNGRKNDNLG